MKRYRTIVADPPWHVGRGPEWGSNGASRSLTYPTMTLDDICSLPVGDLAHRDGAHLYVWTINAYLEQTYEVVRAWGFKPSTLLTWCKPPNGIGLGGAYSLTTEHVLFARRGRCSAKERIDTTWWAWPRSVHSVKPEAFLDMVERVSPAVCPRCHAAHHAWAKRIDRELVLAYAPKVLQFARELGLEWLFDREYPEARAA